MQSSRLLSVMAFVAAFSGQGAFAIENRTVVSDAGDTYNEVRNEHGFVLTSQTSIQRTIDGGQIEDIETIYLGKSCDAFSEVLGEGTWGWGESGFVVYFTEGLPDGAIFFPDMKLSAPFRDCQF